MAPNTFHALGASTTGTVSVSTVGGKTTLTLKNFKTEVGSDLQVRLYKITAPSKADADRVLSGSEFLKIGKLKKFSGDFSFSLPAGAKIAGYKSVAIYCAQVKTAFGAADLKSFRMDAG